MTKHSVLDDKKFNLVMLSIGLLKGYNVVEKIEDLDFEIEEKTYYYEGIEDVMKHLIINENNPKEREITVQVDYVGMRLTTDQVKKIYKNKIYIHKDLPF